MMRFFNGAVVLLFLIPLAGAFAQEDLPLCSADLSKGAECQVILDQVHPGQISVGMKEIEAKREKMAAMSPSKLAKYLAKHVMPCVIGPGGVFYATDAHHDGLAAWLIQQRLYPARIVDNLQSLDQASFWAVMKSRSWVYLYDENGQGPVSPDALPEHLDGMKDDPYRSVAWGVSEGGGYQKTDAPFADFQWANFFRARIAASWVQNDFDQAVTQALALAKSPEASGLPGYLGDH